MPTPVIVSRYQQPQISDVFKRKEEYEEYYTREPIKEHRNKENGREEQKGSHVQYGKLLSSFQKSRVSSAASAATSSKRIPL